MLLRVFVEPQQGATYGELLAIAQASERLGFDAFFRSDHFLKMGTRSTGLPGPTDAWTTLAGLAVQTSTIRLGTLVSSATFRHPAVLAVQVAQVDDMSGGRIELGLGSGWFEAEHRALGIPFPKRRIDLLEEQLEVITGLWSTPVGETFTHHGREYDLVDSPAVPKPVQQSLPVIVGGKGTERTPALAARFAHEFNLPFPDGIDRREAFARVDAACEAIGRDPASLRHSLALVATVGADHAEFRTRAERTGRDPDGLLGTAIAGTVAQAQEALAEASAQGATTVYLQLWDLRDLDHLELLAAELLPVAAELP